MDGRPRGEKSWNGVRSLAAAWLLGNYVERYPWCYSLCVMDRKLVLLSILKVHWLWLWVGGHDRDQRRGEGRINLFGSRKHIDALTFRYAWSKYRSESIPREIVSATFTIEYKWGSYGRPDWKLSEWGCAKVHDRCQHSGERRGRSRYWFVNYFTIRRCSGEKLNREDPEP